MGVDGYMRIAAAFCVGLAVGWSRPAPAADLRLTVGADFIHMQGYTLADLRFGDDGGWGARVGLLKAPLWAGGVPDTVKLEKPQFDLQNVSYWGADREVCGIRWCGVLGVVRLSDTTWANGTQWNFLIGARYRINSQWALEYVHFSHGTALNIATDKSNRGWNFLGVSYTFR